MPKLARLVGVLCLASANAGFSGCSNDSDAERLRKAALSEGCILNSDCTEPMVCAFRKCHNECETSRDCPNDGRCVASDRPFHVCQLGSEKNCQYNSDCPEGQLCGIDGECRDQCSSDRDCVTLQVCVSGTCADQKELDESGSLPPLLLSDASPSEGIPCAYSSECSTPLVCKFGKCAAECLADVDCTTGDRCIDSRCVPPDLQPQDDAGPSSCTYNSDCASPQVCLSGHCVDQCRLDVDCPSGNRCENGQCQPVPPPDAGTGPMCLYNSDCTAPRVCRSGQCVDECKVDIDCAIGQFCEASSCKPIPPPAPACIHNSDCTSPLVCRTGQCVAECVVNVDCASGEQCVSGVCQPLPQPDAGGGGPACIYNSDCVAPLLCLNGRCVNECVTTADCPDGKQCLAGSCVIPQLPDGGAPGYGMPCSLNSECVPFNMICGALDACVFECLGDIDCTTSQCCLGNHCVVDLGDTCTPPPPPPDGGTGGACVTHRDCDDGDICAGPRECKNGTCVFVGSPNVCDDGNPCTIDGCAPITGDCTHAPIAPPDVDQDGHYDASCGGMADDCDDTNPAMYTGHPEICDGIDNNCDGNMDEGAWSAGSVVTISSAETATFRVDFGAPAVAQVDGGNFVVFASGFEASTYPYSKLYAWRTDTSLAPSAAGIVAHDPPAATYDRIVEWPAAASTGSVVAFGHLQYGEHVACGGNYKFDTVVATGDPLLTQAPTATIAATVSGYPNACDPHTVASSRFMATRPALAFNGTNFVAAWSDSHATADSGIGNVYTATVSTGGVLSGTQLVIGDPAFAAVQTDYGNPRVQMAVGTTTAVVAWRQRTTGNSAPTDHLRYVIMDSSLNSVLQGPFDVTQDAESYAPTGAAFVGSTFAVAAGTNTASNDTIRVYRIDAVTGQILNSVTIPNPAGGNDPRLQSDAQLTAVNGGFGLSMSRGTTVTWGWAAEHAGPFTLTDVVAGTTSSAGIVAASATSAAMVWADGTDVKGTIMSCGP